MNSVATAVAGDALTCAVAHVFWPHNENRFPLWLDAAGARPRWRPATGPCRRATSSTPRATCCARWPAPVRIAIVLQLRESARCVHELVDALGVPQPLVSQHLRILKAAGVVAGERSGREVIYRLVDHHLADIVVAAVTHAAEGGWHPRWKSPTAARRAGHPAARGDLRAAGEPRRLPVRPGTARRTAPPRRGHRADDACTAPLQSMAANGLVDTLRTDTGESVYRRCSEHHHHHLVLPRLRLARSRCRAVTSRRGPPRSPASTASPTSATRSKSSASAAAAQPQAKRLVANQLPTDIGACTLSTITIKRLQRFVGQAGGGKVVAQL